MAGRSKVAQEVFEVAEPIVQAMGFDLVDCEYKKEGQFYFLRLFIDKRGGIDIEDCEAVSREVDAALEGKTHADPDYFEVSSPGLTRPLEEPSDFRRYQDEKMDISLFKETDGIKSFTGSIVELDDEKIVFEYPVKKETKTIELKYDEISKAVRHIEF